VLPAFPAGLSERAVGAVLAEVRARSNALAGDAAPVNT
jgi:hypothetical protein